MGRDDVTGQEFQLHQQPRTRPTTGLRSHPIESRDLGSLSEGAVYTPNVLGELFPDLDLEQVVAEGDTTRDIVNKTVRMEDDPLTREKDSPRRYPEAPTISPQPQFSYFKSKQDMICYNCGNRGHACRTCPSKSHLCAELNLSPSRLYHLGQDDVVGDDIQEKETTEEKDATTRLEQLTESFRDLRPHSG